MKTIHQHSPQASLGQRHSFSVSVFSGLGRFSWWRHALEQALEAWPRRRRPHSRTEAAESSEAVVLGRAEIQGTHAFDAKMSPRTVGTVHDGSAAVDFNKGRGRSAEHGVDPVSGLNRVGAAHHKVVDHIVAVVAGRSVFVHGIIVSINPDTFTFLVIFFRFVVEGQICEFLVSG